MRVILFYYEHNFRQTELLTMRQFQKYIPDFLNWLNRTVVKCYLSTFLELQAHQSPS